MKCRRCAGPMFPDEEGERFCLICGERTYDWLGGFLDRLLDAMERQAFKEARGQYGKTRERECTTETEPTWFLRQILRFAQDDRSSMPLCLRVLCASVVGFRTSIPGAGR